MSATSKMSWRLCEISTTARPCSPRRSTRSSTCWVCATPSAAVGSSRITTREFHITALATATDWRWPPERPGDRLAHRADRRDREALERLRRPLLHRRLVEPAERPELLAPEVHVLDDVEVVGEREVLVDDLDAEVRGVLRPVDVDRRALEEDLAAVDRVDAGDALDQRRLAGAVVADERHDLAGGDVEVHLVQRLDRAEGLGDLRAAPGSGEVEGASRRPPVSSVITGPPPCTSRPPCRRRCPPSWGSRAPRCSP